MSGSCDRAFAIITRRFMPPDRSMMRLSRFALKRQIAQQARDVGGIGRAAEEAAAEAHRRPHGLEGVGGQLLRHESDLRARGAVVAHDVVTVRDDAPAARRDDAADDVDQRGLAGAVRAEEGEDLALAYLEIDRLERAHARGVRLTDVLDRDYRRHARGTRLDFVGQACAMRSSNAAVNCAVVALPPRSPVRTWSAFSVWLIAVRSRAASLRQFAMIEHHRRREQQRGRIGDALAGDIGRRAVDRLEDGGVRADVRPRRHAEAAHQAGDQVREDVAEQVGGHQHVELPGIEHELHRAGIDDDRVERESALVLLLVELLRRSRGRSR